METTTTTDLGKITFSKTLLEKSAKFSTINPDKYEAYCLEHGEAYELIFDCKYPDRPVKLVLDFDFEAKNCINPNTEYEKDLYSFVIEESLKVFHNEGIVCDSIGNSSSEKYLCSKDNIYKWKTSVHFVFNNVIGTKEAQLQCAKNLNSLLTIKMKDIIETKDEWNWFDEGIYTKNRRMRSMNCSKFGENRPLTIVKGTFQDSVITAFFGNNPQVLATPQNTFKPISPSPTSVIDIHKTTQNNTQYAICKDFIDAGLLDECVGSGKHTKWINLGYAMKCSFSNENAKILFEMVSKRGTNNKSTNYDVKFDDLKDEVKSGFNHIKTIAKKSCIETFNEIMEKHNVSIRISNDNDCANYILHDFDDILKYNEGQLFYKDGHKWIYDKDTIQKILINRIMELNFVKYDDTTKKETPYSKYLKNAKSICETLIGKIQISSSNSDFYEKIHSSSKGKIAFTDGVLDFVNKKFYYWDDINFEYYTTIIIDRPYAEYFNNPDLTIVAEVKKNIFENMFGKKTNNALQFISRAIAGHNEDKNWGLYIGNRDCGKGVTYEGLEKAFGNEYIKSWELGNIMYQRQTDNNEISRKLYWLMDLQFTRMAVNQEIPATEKGMKMDCKTFKKMTGGGDKIIAKRNYDRVDTHFITDATFMIMGNNELMLDAQDTMASCIEFESVNQFKTQDEINEMIANGEPAMMIAGYKLKDPNIKNACKTDDYQNAIVYLIYQNYSATAVERIRSKDNDDDSVKPLRKRIFEEFIITQKMDDVIPANIVEEKLNDCKKKIKNELNSMNVFKKQASSGEFRKILCYYGLKLIPDAKPVKLDSK